MFWFVVSIIILTATPLDPPNWGKLWIVWNVGQGAWSTLVTADSCLHVDAGGERTPNKTIRKLCGHRPNRVYLTHMDWDHINGLRWIQNLDSTSCLATPSDPTLTSVRKIRLISQLPQCSESSHEIQEIQWPHVGTRSNDRSRVFVIASMAIASGDSPQREERQWAAQVPQPANIRWLLLGHHGSRTSTSHFLMDRLPHLVVGIASAREKKYGHPHSETRATLRNTHRGLLRTEDWGSLVFQI